MRQCSTGLEASYDTTLTSSMKPSWTPRLASLGTISDSDSRQHVSFHFTYLFSILGDRCILELGATLFVYPAQILVLSSRWACWLSQNPNGDHWGQTPTLQPPSCTFLYHLGMQPPSHLPGSLFGSCTASEQAMRQER